VVVPAFVLLVVKPTVRVRVMIATRSRF
jgi:hypothetical protein